MIPVSATILIYFILIRYVNGMSKHVTPANALSRAERELKMARRVIILVMILVAAGLPYAVFVFSTLFTTPPKYHLRIAYAFIDLSLPLTVIILLQFTDTLKVSVKKIFNCRPNAVMPIFT